MEERQYFQHTKLEQLNIHVNKNEFQYLPISYTKNNSNWITDLNIRTKTLWYF